MSRRMSSQRQPSLSPEPHSPGRHKKKEQLESMPSTPPQRRKAKVEEVTDSEDDFFPRALGPQPPSVPKPGLPAHDNRGKRGDKAPPAQLSGLAPHTPPRKSKKSYAGAAYSPFTSKLLSFSTGLPVHLQASPTRVTTAAESKSGRSNKPRMALNSLKHPRDKGWASSGHTPTFEAYQSFERWYLILFAISQTIFSPQHYSLADSVDMVHAGNPFDRPKDIRARPVMFCWNTPNHRPPGHCRHGNAMSNDDPLHSDSDSNSDSGTDSDVAFDDVAEKGYVEVEDGDVSDAGEDADNDDPSDTEIDPSSNNMASLNRQLNSGAVQKTKTKGLRRFKCKVVLHAEVYSDNLNEMHFSNAILIQRRTKNTWTPLITFARLLATFATNKTPVYRRPTSVQVDHVVNYMRRKNRVLSDPLLSIGVFADLNPDKIFSYTPPNYDTDPPSEFATGIHHPYGTQVMILHSQRRGVGHDTTYRNMNENRAPLTIMITVDEDSRMVPGPCASRISPPNQTSRSKDGSRSH
ncbi:hypothetical protein B0H14DRAFT_3700366 [Mycena olivaceomarginata]|nr:hypothetical protein B0H14DRAFT_3700366 [Mycena olivaceomarginata]